MIVFEAQCAETPAGKPFAPDIPSLEIPVAPVVEYVIFEIGLLIQVVSIFEPAPDVSEIVLSGFTVMEPDKVTVPQPPVKDIL